MKKMMTLVMIMVVMATSVFAKDYTKQYNKLERELDTLLTMAEESFGSVKAFTQRMIKSSTIDAELVQLGLVYEEQEDAIIVKYSKFNKEWQSLLQKTLDSGVEAQERHLETVMRMNKKVNRFLELAKAAQDGYGAAVNLVELANGRR